VRKPEKAEKRRKRLSEPAPGVVNQLKIDVSVLHSVVNQRKKWIAICFADGHGLARSVLNGEANPLVALTK
jgi:hypothetical protein